VPLYEMMQVENSTSFRVNDPLYPPKQLRFAAASRFLQFCTHEPGMQHLLTAVAQLYQVHFELASRHSVPTLDGELVVFQCPNDTFNVELTPRTDPDSKQPLPYHCMLCGTELVPTRQFEVGENPFEQQKTTPTSRSEDTSVPEPESSQTTPSS